MHQKFPNNQIPNRANATKSKQENAVARAATDIANDGSEQPELVARCAVIVPAAVLDEIVPEALTGCHLTRWHTVRTMLALYC